MNSIEELLREQIGLDPASIGCALVERAIRQRMKSLGLGDDRTYREILDRSVSELNELVESVVVTETWFFRDAEPFEAMSHFAQQQWLPNHPTGTLRILSIPCSSGEEPCSLAMALLDAGFPPDRFLVEGFDISERALLKARRGVYGRNSFRGPDLAFRRRHFRHLKEGYALNQAVRDRVCYARGNLLENGLLQDHPPYDLVLCRNLLIYFDQATRKRAVEKLQSLLAQSGLLFVGPAELPIVTDGPFVSAALPMAFACRKTDPAEKTSRPHAVRALRTRPPLAKPVALPGYGIPPRRGAPPTERELKHPAELPNLDHAQRLADAGHLQDAATICESYLAATHGSARAYYLLGLVRDAAGDTLSAIDCYRKALYLEPDHYETLLHMATLAEKTGDRQKARVLKRRAERANPNI